MRVALLSREFPPEIYGGAGIHAQYLAAALAQLVDLEVHCFGSERPADPSMEVFAYQPWERLEGDAPLLGALRTMSVDLCMAAALKGVDIVHSHTWYANWAGYLAHILYDVPHVVTVHSLEPLRPWKAEQLGAGYRLSSLCERMGVEGANAIVAVSNAVARDISACYPLADPSRITIIPNAVDPEEFRPDPRTDVLERYGIDIGRPIVVFFGRVTRQKGIAHLLNAFRDVDPGVQLVLRAGAAGYIMKQEASEKVLGAVRQVLGGGIYVSEKMGSKLMHQLIGGKPSPAASSMERLSDRELEIFGLIGQGANIYLTIAHSDLETLVVNGHIVSTAAGPTPYMDQSGNITHAPCWNALFGQFLYSSDSPGKQLLRYLVSDTSVFFDKPAAATLTGPPPDLTVDGSLLGVIDGGDGHASNASLFDIDSEGELTLRFAVKIASPINGAAIID